MSVAANRYAKALIDVLYPENAEMGYEHLVRLRDLLRDQPAARQFFENPTVPFDRRKTLAHEIATHTGLDARILNFVDILIERNRLELLEEIISTYRGIMDERLGILRAVVTTATPIDASAEKSLSAQLERATGKQIRMEVAVDPSLIGGVVAQIGTTVFDGSVRQQLQAFRNAITER